MDLTLRLVLTASSESLSEEVVELDELASCLVLFDRLVLLRAPRLPRGRSSMSVLADRRLISLCIDSSSR
jgi:hypothetical protein